MFSSVYEENRLKYEYVGSRFAAGQCYRLRILSESETKTCMQASPISSACALAILFAARFGRAHGTNGEEAKKMYFCILESSA